MADTDVKDSDRNVTESDVKGANTTESDVKGANTKKTWRGDYKTDDKGNPLDDKGKPLPMIVHRQRYTDSDGVQHEKVHGPMPVQEWADYEAENNL